METDPHQNDVDDHIEEMEGISTSVVPKEQSRTSADYESRTLRLSSVTGQRRRSLLPAYPTHKYDTQPALLLLTNVHTIDRELMEVLSYSGDDEHGNFQYCPFTMELNQKHEFLSSFLIDFYEKLYVNTSERWKLEICLIDYNLTRLRTCMSIYSKQVGEAAFALFDELPIALEFYLQIDVDLFFMKTCDYRNAQPRFLDEQREKKEGLLCQREPIARYGTKPCRGNRCFLCKREKDPSAVVRFSDKQIHQFINGYQAILNCPATCDTSNIVYALTCACNEYDYIGSTVQPFVDRIFEHREEGHRIIREFLIGPENVKSILDQDKRKMQPLADPYDRILYHHSARCHYGLQRFLDRNPMYWCFVPQLHGQVKLDNEHHRSMKKNKKNNDHQYHDKLNRPTALNVFADVTVLAAAASDTAMTTQQQSQIQPVTTSEKPMLFAPLLVGMKRTKEEAQLLVRNIPDPPQGYGFSIQQREEQFEFFQEKKDNLVFPSDFVDLYNYSIVTVLPLDCSRHLRQFIAALFCTHAETKLNMIGRLTHSYPNTSLDYLNRGNWCSQLIHPRTSIINNNNESFD